MNYDILLIYTQRSFYGGIGLRAAYGKIIGLDILAACANEKGYSARLYTGDVNHAVSVIEQEIEQNHVRLIGFYCHYDNQTDVAGLSRRIKETSSLPVLVGGPQSVVLGDAFLAASKADAVVRGEGELTFLELLDYYLAGKGTLEKIKGIIFRNSCGEVVKTPDRELIKNLDALPFPNPAKHHLPSEFSNRQINIMTGRGCAFSCSFCYEGHNTKTVRFRSVENVLSEVEQRLEQEGEKKSHFICFNDDTFTIDPCRVLKICEGLRRLRKQYDFTWFCEAHVKTLIKRPDILPVMIKSGLVRLQLGLESGVQRVLDAYRKQVTLEEILTVVKLCAEHELPMLFCNVICGGAFETQETVEETERFVKKLMESAPGILAVSTMIFIPFPHTPMSREPQKYGLTLLDATSETSLGEYATARTETLTREEITRLNQWLLSRIKTNMVALRNKIPFKQIRRLFQIEATYGISSEWCSFFNEEHHMQTYCMRMVNAPDPQHSSDIPPAAFPSFRPMRTVRLLEQDQDGLSIFRIRLTALESEVIRYASGKLTVAEISRRLSPLYGKTMSEKEFMGQVIDILKVFEQRYWVSFSEL